MLNRRWAAQSKTLLGTLNIFVLIINILAPPLPYRNRPKERMKERTRQGNDRWKDTTPQGRGCIGGTIRGR